MGLTHCPRFFDLACLVSNHIVALLSSRVADGFGGLPRRTMYGLCGLSRAGFCTQCTQVHQYNTPACVAPSPGATLRLSMMTTNATICSMHSEHAEGCNFVRQQTTLQNHTRSSMGRRSVGPGLASGALTIAGWKQGLAGSRGPPSGGLSGTAIIHARSSLNIIKPCELLLFINVSPACSRQFFCWVQCTTVAGSARATVADFYLRQTQCTQDVIKITT